MKPQWLLTALMGLLVVLAVNALVAAPPPTTGTPPSEQVTPPSSQEMKPAETTEEAPGEKHMEGATAEHGYGISCRASDLIGMSIKNKAGEDLGSLQDLVFDPKTGGIRYAALARGGILGIGEKLVAVPWNAFELKLAEREQRGFRPGEASQSELDKGVVAKDRFQLILDVDVKAIEQHPGFTKDKWPESGDQGLLQKGTGTVQETPSEQTPVEEGPAVPVTP